MLPRKLFATERELQEAYEDLGSTQKVADRFGVSKKLILTYMKRLGIERNQRKTPESYRGDLERMARDGKGSSDIGRELKISSTYVLMLAKKLGIKVTDNFHRGYRISDNGYRMIRRIDHPEADTGGYVREHRLVAEAMLGRSLEADEVVHHVNGDKLDNRPENLVIMKKPDHVSHHHKGKRKNKSRAAKI